MADHRVVFLKGLLQAHFPVNAASCISRSNNSAACHAG
jgi:hypothetical protein